MAASQAMIVHEGVQYDLQVDTTTNTALECATTIAAYVADH
jgi:chloramphenicol 3-O phosphotransferase